MKKVSTRAKLTTLLATSPVFGTIDAPPGVSSYDKGAGGFGLTLFISNLIKLATIAAGLWTLLNIVLAGYEYITGSGDSGAHQKVRQKITMSIIGLAIIVFSYTLMAIIGLIFFGDAGYILSPTVTGPTP